MRLYDKVDLSECYHLLENHVLLDDRDLIDRLIRGDMENDYTYSGHRRDIATKFYSKEDALKIISDTILNNTSAIKSWLDFRTERYLTISSSFMHPTGYGYAKGTLFSNKYTMYFCTVNIVVINCDDKYVEYEWASKEAFVEDMESNNENIPMLDDALAEVNTQDDNLQLWWRNTDGLTVDDLLEECKQELCM